MRQHALVPLPRILGLPRDDERAAPGGRGVPLHCVFRRVVRG